MSRVPFANMTASGNSPNPQDLLSKFAAHFTESRDVILVRAPGRVNLIGEHTDYNDGFVLPAAINFSCYVAAAARSDRQLHIYSEEFQERVEVDLDSLQPTNNRSWSSYPLGVAWSLLREKFKLRGANIYITGDVPLGSGLSSSAAIEVSTGYALLQLAQQPIDLTRLAQLCRAAENEFVGAHVGIMDQFVSCHGRAGHAVLLDCRSLTFETFPIPPELLLVVCNTMVKHEHASNAYNERRAQCEEAVARLSKVLPNVRALRDVTLAQLEQHRDLLTPVVYKRAHHVVSEDQRTLSFVAALRSSQLAPLKKLMADSHASLRDDFEVSCPELDTMVEIAAQQTGVFGARMTGGGFGGCTVNLVGRGDAKNFQEVVAEKYFAATNLHPEIYICQASQGVELISPSNSASSASSGSSSSSANSRPAVRD